MLYRLWLMTEPSGSDKFFVALDYAKEWGLFLPGAENRAPGVDLVVIGYEGAGKPWDLEEAAVCPSDPLRKCEWYGGDTWSLRRPRYSSGGIDRPEIGTFARVTWLDFPPLFHVKQP
jgi:hypothetical protein